MDPAAAPVCPSDQRAFACTSTWPGSCPDLWRAQRSELRRQLSALLCSELMPLPAAEHATLCATVNVTLTAYLATGSQVLHRAWQQCHRQRDAARHRLLLHLLTHIEGSSSHILAFGTLCAGSDPKASFYSALAGCCRQLLLRFVLEEQLLEVLQEAPPPGHRQHHSRP